MWKYHAKRTMIETKEQRDITMKCTTDGREKVDLHFFY